MKTIVVQEEFDIPAEKIWKIVTEEFGQISNWHPEVISSKITSEDPTVQNGRNLVDCCYQNGFRFAFERPKSPSLNP